MKRKFSRAAAAALLLAALLMVLPVTALAQEAGSAGGLTDLGSRLPEIKKAVADTGSGFLALDICRQLKDFFLALLS